MSSFCFLYSCFVIMCVFNYFLKSKISKKHHYLLGNGVFSMLSILSLQLPQDYKNEMLYSRNEMQMKRSSRASDTSSAYSGSDMMQSSIDDQENPDMDLSGMPEGYVDSDEEEDKLSNTEVLYQNVLTSVFVYIEYHNHASISH